MHFDNIQECFSGRQVILAVNNLIAYDINMVSYFPWGYIGYICVWCAIWSVDDELHHWKTPFQTWIPLITSYFMFGLNAVQ